MTEGKPLLISGQSCRMAERISLALAIKGLSFRTAEASALKEEYSALSRCIDQWFPLLLTGKDGPAGWVTALDLLEKTNPEPSLFPNSNRGMPIALSFWSEHAASGPHHAGLGNPHADLVARQLTDGRAFLQGDAPGLADIESYIAVRHTSKDNHPPLVSSWMKKMTGLKKSVASEPVEVRQVGYYLQNLEPVSRPGKEVIGPLADALPAGLKLYSQENSALNIAFPFDGKSKSLAISAVDLDR